MFADLIPQRWSEEFHKELGKADTVLENSRGDICLVDYEGDVFKAYRPGRHDYARRELAVSGWVLQGRRWIKAVA